MPGGTEDQPSDAATSLTYSFDVAHWMNCFPSLTCFDEAGIPRAHDQSHCAPFGTLPIGAGAKANHLAYLGDSEVGDKVNIGAGTITCNYDGVQKHRTRIGKDAFIGSNSTLVAPIEIGDGSYVGAGSVITDPVPPEALALGRGRQVIKKGWAAARKKKK